MSIKEKFEIWARSQGLHMTHLQGSNEYESYKTQGAWLAWQAAQPSVPEPCQPSNPKDSNHRSYAEGWNDCRNAMLEVAPTAPADDQAQQEEAYADENGTAWESPTAWAYAQACKANDKWRNSSRDWQERYNKEYAMRLNAEVKLSAAQQDADKVAGTLVNEGTKSAKPDPTMAVDADLGWQVRERRDSDGELLDCFVEAPQANGMAYGLEVLGDDYTGYGDVGGKLEHCRMIVAWANTRVQPASGNISNDLLKFLHGSGEIDNVAFGERHPAHRGRFWWRALLPQPGDVQPASGRTQWIEHCDIRDVPDAALTETGLALKQSQASREDAKCE